MVRMPVKRTCPVKQALHDRRRTIATCDSAVKDLSGRVWCKHCFIQGEQEMGNSKLVEININTYFGVVKPAVFADETELKAVFYTI